MSDHDIEQTLTAVPEFSQADEPIALFQAWLKEAGKSEINDPNAFALATADTGCMPSARMVLLKGVDAKGFVFYTNFESRKGRELSHNPRAGMCFHWKSLRRQVRVCGPVETVSPGEADAYFASRPRGSRIGAWASKQSRPLESRMALEKAVAFHGAKFNIGEIPRPPYWSGYRIVPVEIEFWHDRKFRLHERIAFRRASVGEVWEKTRLYP